MFVEREKLFASYMYSMRILPTTAYSVPSASKALPNIARNYSLTSQEELLQPSQPVFMNDSVNKDHRIVDDFGNDELNIIFKTTYH